MTEKHYIRCLEHLLPQTSVATGISPAGFNCRGFQLPRVLTRGNTASADHAWRLFCALASAVIAKKDDRHTAIIATDAQIKPA